MSNESQTISEFLKSLAGDLYDYNPQYCAALAKSAEHVERQQALISELEQQAAIGRLAVKMLDEVQYSGGGVYCPGCGHAEPDGVWHGHSDACEIAAILRDAQLAGMGVGP